MFYSPEDIVKELLTPTVRMRLLKNGIVHYTYFPNVEIDVEQHIENNNALISLVGMKTRYPILLDSSEMINFTSAAMAKARELEPTTPVLARAFVTNSFGLKLMISFYLKVKKSYVENKVFTNYESAVKWLLQLKPKAVF